MVAVPSVDDVVRRVAMWSGRVVAHRPISGGLSHHIWRVDAGPRSFVLRVLDPAIAAAGLGVAPVVEIANTIRAAESGVGARVFEVLPEIPALVLEYLPGRTLSAADVRQPAMIPRIAAAVRRLHAGPAFDNHFSIAAKLGELLDLCRRNGLPIPPTCTDRLSTVDQIVTALAAEPVIAVPCHNDLLPANFIDSGGVVRIIDYQLAGNNDPCFELGDIAAEAEFDADLTAALTAAYFGAATTPALIARVRLNLVLSNVTWTLWFSVHHGLLPSAAGFDYAAEAAGKWARAERDLDGPDLPRLLDAVTGGRPPNRTDPARR